MVEKKIEKLKSDLFDSVKDELSKLSPIKRWLFETLFEKIWAVFSEDCNETEIASAINSLEKVNSEYVRPNDVLNYDESMQSLTSLTIELDLNGSWILEVLNRLFLRIVK